MPFDPSYPGLKLIIECDGRQHAENTGQWRRDLSRRS
jgi:very-short-patch-repair endonuclease